MAEPQKKKRGRPKKIRFEDKFEIIQRSIGKRKGKWFLKAINWIGWDDVSQIICAHIYKKWHLWDQKRPLEPWLNRIISNQIKNVLRNHYTNFIRPCVQCPFNTSGAISKEEMENACSWTSSKKQDCNCPLFKKWSKSKKYSQDINLAANIDDVLNFSAEKNGIDFDIDKSKDKLNKLMKVYLSEKQYTIYKMLYIDNKSISEVGKIMGYKSNEKGRRAGYKQIKNFEKVFKALAQKLLKEEDII
jgi:hypothetical protein